MDGLDPAVEVLVSFPLPAAARLPVAVDGDRATLGATLRLKRVVFRRLQVCGYSSCSIATRRGLHFGTQHRGCLRAITHQEGKA